MGAFWVVFLVYPLLAAWGPGMTPWRSIVTTALVAVFAVVYLLGFVDADRPTHRERRVKAWLWLAGLLALIALTWPFIGLDALGMVTFVIALGAFTLPLRPAVVLAVTLVALEIALIAAHGALGEAWFLPMIAVVTGGWCLFVRVLQEQDGAHQEVATMLSIAQERERVARDVHDVLGHSLTVITVKAELAERLIDLDPQRARAEVADILSLSRQSLAEIRATVSGLRVARLADELDSTRAALASAGIDGVVEADPAAVDPRHRITLAWALRESVTNVVRHSGAGSCTVRCGEDWLEVTDTGRGVRGRREGNGIRGLRERVEAAAGRLSVSPGPDGRGTRVRVELGEPHGSHETPVEGAEPAARFAASPAHGTAERDVVP